MIAFASRTTPFHEGPQPIVSSLRPRDAILTTERAMASLLADQIDNAIEQVESLYHSFVLLVAPHGSGKTFAFA